MGARSHEPDPALCQAIAEQCACFHVRKAARAVTNWYDNALHEADLSSSQFVMLLVAYLLGPANMTRFAQTVGIDRSTLTRNLRPLIDRGLVTTAPGPGRGLRQVTITDHGQRTLNEAIPHWQRAQARVVETIGDERWREIVGRLGDLSVAVRDPG